MKNLNKLVLFAAFLLLPMVVMAQGSGSSDPDKKDKNFAVTRSVSGVLDSKSSNSIVIKTKKGNKITLKTTENTEWVGSPKIGQRVKATYMQKDRKVTVVAKI